MNCPICGEKLKTTSGVCPKHIGQEYDKDGHLVAYTDMVKVTEHSWGTQRILLGAVV